MPPPSANNSIGIKEEESEKEGGSKKASMLEYVMHAAAREHNRRLMPRHVLFSRRSGRKRREKPYLELPSPSCMERPWRERKEGRRTEKETKRRATRESHASEGRMSR